MIRALFVVAAALALSACASNKPYSCSLNDQAHCRNMQEVYDAARKASRNDARQNVVGGRTIEYPLPVTHNTDRYAEPGEHGQPVFRQPRVYRVWLAPYVDADGNLRSGEYVYFSTPGEWAYGTTRDSGVAGAAMFGPQRPENIGFTPVETGQATPPAPSGSLPQPASVTNRDGIVQPAQRLTP